MSERLAHEVFGMARSVEPKVLVGYLANMGQNISSVIRQKNLSSVDRTVRGPITFKTWGKSITLDCGEIDDILDFDPSSCFGLAREIYCRDVYLRAFERFDAIGAAAADFGGNRGVATALIAAALSPDTIAYVEPEQRYLPVMRRLIAPYTDTLVVAHHGFIGSGPGEVLEPEAILPDGPIAFLKMDIEGAEETLFTSAGEWLQRVERIAMESHPDWCNVANVVAALRSRGFEVAPTDAMGRLAPPSVAGFVYAARNVNMFRPAYRTSSI